MSDDERKGKASKVSRRQLVKAGEFFLDAKNGTWEVAAPSSKRVGKIPLFTAFRNLIRNSPAFRSPGALGYRNRTDLRTEFKEQRAAELNEHVTAAQRAHRKKFLAGKWGGKDGEEPEGLKDWNRMTPEEKLRHKKLKAAKREASAAAKRLTKVETYDFKKKPKAKAPSKPKSKPKAKTSKTKPKSSKKEKKVSFDDMDEEEEIEKEPVQKKKRSASQNSRSYDSEDDLFM
jgi:hypothetical protein